MHDYKPGDDPVRQTWETYQQRRTRTPLGELTSDQVDQAIHEQAESNDVA